MASVRLYLNTEGTFCIKGTITPYFDAKLVPQDLRVCVREGGGQSNETVFKTWLSFTLLQTLDNKITTESEIN